MKNTKNNIKLNVKDPIVERVIRKYAERCEIGMKNMVGLYMRKEFQA